MRRIAIIGAGAAGVAVAHALTEQLDIEFQLTIFDPTLRSAALVARGLAYQADVTEPLLNAPGQMMSIVSSDDRHFLRWHEARVGHRKHGHLYASRPVFGDYLRDSLVGLRARWAARAGVLHLVPFRVERIHSAGDSTYRIETEDAIHTGFDEIVLCPGWSELQAPSAGSGTVPTYPLQESVRAANQGRSVLILGTGLTAVDAARALLNDGYTGSITMTSRRGLLPNVRPDAPAIRPRTVTRQWIRDRTSLTVRDLVQSVRTEARLKRIDLAEVATQLRGHRTPTESLRRGLSGADDEWARLMVGLADEAISEAWHRFDLTSKMLFLRTLHPFFQSWCNPMPRSTAALLRDAADSGQLTICGGAQRWNGAGMLMADGTTEVAETTIRAHRAAQDRYLALDTGVLSGMLHDGLAVEDRFGGFDIEFDTGRVRDACGTPQPIYAVGALSQGSRYYVSALDGILRAVDGIVEHIKSVPPNRERAEREEALSVPA